MVAPSRLLSLPTQLLASIVSLLYEDPRDVLTCQLTCRQFCRVVQHSDLLRYALRTRQAGVVDTFCSGISVLDRLNIFERWEKPWPFPTQWKPAYSLAFHEPCRPDGGRGDHFLRSGRLVSVMSTNPFTYTIHDLRQRLIRWSRVGIPAVPEGDDDDEADGLQDYTFVFESDLLVLTYSVNGNIELAMFSISRGTPHPSAPAHRVSLDAVEVVIGVTKVTVAMRQEDIFVHCAEVGARHAQSEVYMVSWKSGTATSIELEGCDSGHYSPCFEMLHENMVMFFEPQHNCIELSSMERDESDQDEEIKADPACLLFLPLLGDCGCLETVTSDMEPFQSGLHSLPSPLDTCQAHLRIPFQSLPENELIAFDAVYEGFSLKYLIPRKTLLRFANITSGHDYLRPHIPWRLWGPQSAHIILSSSVNFGKIVGERWFFEDNQGLGFRDFNVARVQEAARLFGRGVYLWKNGCSVRVVTDPIKVVSRGNVFAEDIISALPYVETRLPMSPDRYQDLVDMVALDNEKIILISDKMYMSCHPQAARAFDQEAGGQGCVRRCQIGVFHLT